MFEIGNTLREARMRRDLDIRECEAATKIRSKYLRAMEEEQFDLMPSSAYVRGFLRTYADFLDLDGRLMLDEYESRYGDAGARPEEGRRAQPPRAERRTGGIAPAQPGRPPRRGRRRRSEAQLLWLAIGGVTGVAVLVWMGVGGSEPSSDVPIPPPVATTTTQQATSGAASTTAPEAAAPSRVAIGLTAVGSGSWVQVRGRNSSGPVVFEGTMAPGQSETWRVGRSIWLRVGDSSGVELTVDGETTELSGGTGDYIVSRSGARQVSAG